MMRYERGKLGKEEEVDPKLMVGFEQDGWVRGDYIGMWWVYRAGMPIALIRLRQRVAEMRELMR
jgi:hypothetical protein